MEVLQSWETCLFPEVQKHTGEKPPVSPNAEWNVSTGDSLMHFIYRVELQVHRWQLASGPVGRCLCSAVSGCRVHIINPTRRSLRRHPRLNISRYFFGFPLRLISSHCQMRISVLIYAENNRMRKACQSRKSRSAKCQRQIC